MENKNYSYGIRLAIIYSFVWFIDLLDASTLNVSLPAIAGVFHIDPTKAEWAIVGFLLSMSIAIMISSWLGTRFGTRRIFLLSQLLYIGASIGCGFSFTLSSFIFFRFIQGFAAGMAIPLGMAALLSAMPQKNWAKTSANMNMVTLIAPAIGPIFGAYITKLMGWSWIFFLKLPLSFICFFLSLYWVKEEKKQMDSKFDWLGFLFGSFSLSGMIWVFSEVGKNISTSILLIITFFSLLSAALFLWIEKRNPSPLIPLSLFKIRHFAFGNLIQSTANTIFLGANFMIAFYLQKGLGLHLVTVGWIMATITPGMIIVQPFVGKFYNRLGPLPFMIPGLLLLAFSTFAFSITNSETSPFILGFLVFCIGAASSLAQTANVTSIFSGLPYHLKGSGSAIYSVFKQISASFGIAISTMVLSIGMSLDSSLNSPSLTTFHICFIVLGFIPVVGLFLCFFIDNKLALSQISSSNTVIKETEPALSYTQTTSKIGI